MYPVQQQVTHRPPVPLRMNVHTVPGVPLETGAAARRNQSKFAARRAEISVEVWCVDLCIDAELVHWRRLRDDVESETTRFVPRRNRLDKRSCRKHAMPDRPDAISVDGRT